MISTTEANKILKEYYATKTNLHKELYQKSLTMAMIPKKFQSGGKNIDLPFKVGNPQAVSGDFGVAYAAANTGNSSQRFEDAALGWDSYFSHWSMPIKKKLQSNRSDHSFMKLLRSEIDGSLETIRLGRINHLWGNGSGKLGVIKSISNTEISLNNVSEVCYFDKGTILNFKTASSDSVRQVSGADATATVTKVDRDAGKITVDAVPSGVAAADEIYRNGDVVAIEATGRTRYMAGFEAWCPKTVESNDNFFGVNRSSDRFRLAGTHITQGSGTSLEETLVKAAGRVRRQGAMVRYLVMNCDDFADLIDELGSKVDYNKQNMIGSDGAGIGFKTLSLHGAGGTIEVYDETYVPKGTVWGYNPEDLLLECLGSSVIMPWNEDGKTMDRVQGANSITGASHSYIQMLCHNPKNLLRISLTA